MKEKEEVKREFKLPVGKITVKPIIKSTYLVPDVNHKAAFLVPGAKRRYTAPISRSTGHYSNVLTDAEKDYFESALAGMDLKQGDLSVYKKDNSFWDTFGIILTKEGITLDKSNPYQYLQYKVLLANTEEIAQSMEDVRNKRKATYKFVLVDAHEADRISAKEADIEEHAWASFGDIKNDRNKMFDVLRIYGRKPSIDATDNFLRSQLKERLKEDPKEFVSIVDDPNLDTKVLVENAVTVGALQKRSNAYSLPGGDKIGTTLYEAAMFLNKPENQEILLQLQAKVDDK